MHMSLCGSLLLVDHFLGMRIVGAVKVSWVCMALGWVGAVGESRLVRIA